MRIFWGTLGLIALALGFIGVFLPIMPTVPFLLVAAFCFSRSSKRMHNWLIEHPTFGRQIRDWMENGAISRRTKVLASGSLAMSLIFPLLLNVGRHLLLLQITLLVLLLVYLWTRPEP